MSKSFITTLLSKTHPGISTGIFSVSCVVLSELVSSSIMTHQPKQNLAVYPKNYVDILEATAVNCAGDMELLFRYHEDQT